MSEQSFLVCENCNKKYKMKSYYEKHIQNCSSNKKEEKNKNPDVELAETDIIHSINSDFKFIDLFCGIGGFHQAMRKMNGECVFACDIDEHCRKIYKKNYGITPHGDITEIDISSIPSFDVLCAGFPCQPFSKAGKQKGFEDDRGNLFFNICDIIKHHNPKYLVLENVRNLHTHDNGNTWKVIRENINKLGYNTYDEPLILNVLHFNVPQNRERVIILAKRKDLGDLPTKPKISKSPKNNLNVFIKDIIYDDEELNKEYKVDGKMKDVEKVWDDFIKILIKHRINIPKFPIWTDWWDKDFEEDDDFYKKYKNWIDKNIDFYKTNKNILKDWLLSSRNIDNWNGAVRKFEWQAGDLNKDDGMDKVLWTPRGSGIRTKRPDYIPTLVAMSMIPIYGPKHRKLNPRELLRLQSFPDSFVYDKKKILKQVGNSVNVTMIERCSRFIMNNEPLFL
jgi:DNA (cytosine-5)-methyltransferase 1